MKNKNSKYFRDEIFPIYGNYYYSQILSPVISLSVTESFSNRFPNHTCGEGSVMRVHSLELF